LRFSFQDFADYLRSVQSEVEANRVGVIAPQLVSDTGAALQQLHLFRRPTAQRMSRLAALFSNYYLLLLHKRLGDVKRAIKPSWGTPRAALESGQKIFAPHGALFVFSREFLADKDALNYPCFLFGEETFVGL